MDINDEVALGRCLTPTELSAKVINGEFIEFSWTKSKGATEFVLELYSDEEMKQKVETFTIPAADVPYTADLEADMTYYARVKGVNGDGVIEDSNWATFDRALQTYAIKSSLNPELVERTASSITIKWTKDPEVDHIRITPALNAGEDYTRFEVSADAQAAAQVEVTGLNPSVKYTLAVHFKSADRGQITAWTQPDLEGVTRVESAEAFAAALADGQSRFVFPYNDGIRYELGELQINHSLELYGETSKDGKFPNVLVSIKFKNGGTADAKFHFEQLHLDGSAGQVYGERSNIIDISEAVVTNKIEFFTVLNCEVSNYTKNIYYDNKGVTLGSLVLRESIFTNIGSASQDFASFRADATACNSILIENNTIINNHRDILRIDKCAVPSIIFRNNTVVTNGKLTDGGLFIVQKDVTVFEMTSNLFLDVYKAENGLILDAKCKAPTLVANNFFYNSDTEADPLGTSKELLLANGGAVLESSPCKDYIGGVCNVIDETVLAAKAGDPRWLVPYVEVPEDLTQTVTSTITTWDLNDATVFRGKADKDMVRGNIRFYVTDTPFNLGGGVIEFTGKSTVGDTGVPTDAGMGIKVNEPGSIVVSTAASELAGDHSHLTVSLNGEVSASVPVGAEYQKVTFPNITEESTVYITACDPIAISFLQWTDDIEVINNVLDTPVLSIDKTSVQERDEETVTVSWEAVDYAGAYEVTFNEKKTVVTETSFEINTAVLSVEEDGADFKVSVKAVPDSDDYIRVESQPAEVSFHVNDVPVVSTGGIPSDPLAIETFEELGLSTMTTTTIAKGTSHQEGKFTLVALSDKDLVVEPNKPRVKIGGSSKVGDDGIPTGGYISFKITTPGTITHKVISSSSDATTRKTKVALVKNGIATIIYNENAPVSSGADAVTTEITKEMLAGVTTTCTVYVYGDEGAVNIHELSFDPQPIEAGIPSDPLAIEVDEELGLSTMTTTTIAKGTSHQEGKFTLVALSDKDLVVEPNKPRVKIGGSSKVGDDGIPTGGYISFKITTPGTITHKVISSSSDATTRKTKVALVKNGIATIIYNENAPVSSGADAVTTEITKEMLAGVTTTCTVYVYGDEGAVNIHELKYAPSK